MQHANGEVFRTPDNGTVWPRSGDMTKAWQSVTYLVTTPTFISQTALSAYIISVSDLRWRTLRK